MTVLAPNAGLGVRRRLPGALDAHGWPLPGDWGPTLGPWPGRTHELADGAWDLAVDPDGWPLQAGDLVVDTATQQSWMIVDAVLLTNNLDSRVDYVRINARERAGAATEPVVIPAPTTRHA